MFISGAAQRARPTSRPIQILASRLVQAAILVLACFHAWLFRAQILDGKFFEPAMAARWIAAALILTAFLALRRRGVPVLWGRRAVVLWLFVVFLHWHAIAASPGAARDASTLPAAAGAVATTIGLAPVVAALGLAVLAALRRREAAGLRVVRLVAAGATGSGAVLAGTVLQISSRPPPA